MARLFPGLAPARRRLVLAAVVVLVLALAAAVGAVAFSSVHRNTTAAAQDDPGPVLLVPGYGGSTSALDQLASTLRAYGRDATVVAMPDGGTGDLNQQARTLQTAVDSALRRTGKPSVDVIGYSAGGVVARLWLRDDGGAAKARRVITLGSPQHGTQLASAGADLGCPTACVQLAVDSDLLRRLNAGDETPRGPALVSIWSTEDQVVVPPDSARLDGAINIPIQDVCPAASVAHGQLPTDHVVQAMVRSELSGPATTNLTASDCARLSV